MPHEFTESAITTQDQAETKYLISGADSKADRSEQDTITNEHEAHTVDKSALLSAELSAASRREQINKVSGMAAIFFSVILSLIFFARIGLVEHYYHISRTALLLAYVIFLLPFMAITGTSVMMIRSQRQAIRRKAQRLRAVRSTGAAGALIDVLSRDNSKVQNSAALGLLEILRRRTADDLDALEPRQRRIIHSFVLGAPVAGSSSKSEARLSARTRTDLRMVFCETLGREGNYSDLELLRQTASDQPPTADGQAVRQAAWIAVRQLEQRLADHVPQKQLLRASEQPTANEDELLRAAHPGQTRNSEDLLRPDRPE